ncbi:MAG: cytochrome P450 [Candidatus Nanopelagicales bacterium]
MRRIGVDPLAFLAEQWRAHGDVVQFPIPAPPTYLVCHPEDVRTVLVGRSRDVGKDTLQYRALAKVTGQGLLTSDNPLWREHRRILQPAFHPDTLPAVVAHTDRAATRTATRLRSAGPRGVVDIDALVMTLALEVVGESLFGHALGPVAERLGEATLTALGEVVSMARMPLRAPRWIPTPGNRRMAQSLGELDAAVADILAARREQRASDPPDMLDLLLASSLDARAVRDEIVTFLVAGHETVASALTWALILLAGHPEVADQVAGEAAAVLGGAGCGSRIGSGPSGEDHPALQGPDSPTEAHAQVTMGQLAELRVARAVIDEAMRLHPPAWLITRKTSADLLLGGAHVPAGSLVIISPWIVHRHPTAWTSPEEFDPQRFLTTEGAPAGRRHGYLPFGAGPRMCIGRDFAYAEAVLALAIISRAVRLAPTGSPVRALPLVTIRPDRPALMRVTAR